MAFHFGDVERIKAAQAAYLQAYAEVLRFWGIPPVLFIGR